MTVSTSRRGFLKGATAAGAVLLVGVTPKGVLAAASDSTMLNPFVKITTDGSITAIVKHFEKGQGPATGLSTGTFASLQRSILRRSVILNCV